VKILLDSYTDDWFRSKFRQEMEALARVEHPGVVGMLDAGETQSGRPYFVMQYLEGRNLRSFITPEGCDYERTAHWFRQIGKALQTAHEKGVIHRDLKPENIMIQNASDGTEEVRLIDFGLAKVKNSQTAKSTSVPTVIGSFGYISPEQLLSRPATPASDVYALGVIAYELLTGRRPFQPDSVFELLDRQREGVKVQPVDLRPGLAPRAQYAILKALSFEPQDRYQSASEFCEELASALTSISSLSPLTSKRTTNVIRHSGSGPIQFVLLNVTLATLALKQYFFRFLSWNAYFQQWTVILLLLALGAGVYFLSRRIQWPAYVLSTLLAAALLLPSNVIQIRTIEEKIDTNSVTLNYSDPKGYRYTFVNNRYCLVMINPGYFNHVNNYQIELKLSPEIEFADIYFDRNFSVMDQLQLNPSNTNDIVRIQKTGDDFHTPRKILFTYKYRTVPKEPYISVSMKVGDSEIKNDAKIPL
ncbi:MAG: hypothetical protein C5B54_07585, partial [Acidobacteria bacterium]